MSQASKPCPFCGENIRPEAIKCRFCGEILDQQAYEQARAEENGRPPGPGAPAAPLPAGTASQNAPAGNQVLFRASPSLFTSFGALFLGALIIAAAIFLAVFPPELLGQYAKSPLVQKYFLPYRALGAAALALLVILVLAIKVLLVKATTYTITVDRLELEEGLFSKTRDNLDMFRVKDLALNRSFLDRVVGIGSVAITTSDPSHHELELNKIRGAKRAYEILKEASLAADQRRRVIHYE